MSKIVSYDHKVRVKTPLYLVQLSVLAIIGLGVWSHFAPLDEIVRGSGKVTPKSQTQVIQSLEGGILATLPVWEGKTVEAGDLVATLSDNQFQGAFDDTQSQILAIEARLIRLSQEMKYADSLNLSKTICSEVPKVCQSEYYFFQASRKEFISTRAGIKSSISLQEEEVALKKNLTEQDILPDIDLIKAEQGLTAEKIKLSEYLSNYQTSRSKEYADSLAELNSLKAQLSVREDQLSRTELRAPVRSIVNKISITTIGGVAPPGVPILELTPLDEELRIEAKISPKDVAFIRPGMRTTVKLTAYDYSIYGSLQGKVTHVSADTFQDEDIREEKPYYKVYVSINDDANNHLKGNIEVRPGMVADVELHTGSKTVLQYLAKPLLKSKEAFRER